MRNLKAQVNIGEAHTAYSLADSFIFHTLCSDSADEKNNKEDFIRQIKPKSLRNSIPVEQRKFYICFTDRKKGVPCIIGSYYKKRKRRSIRKTKESEILTHST